MNLLQKAIFVDYLHLKYKVIIFSDIRKDAVGGSIKSPHLILIFPDGSIIKLSLLSPLNTQAM